MTSATQRSGFRAFLACSATCQIKTGARRECLNMCNKTTFGKAINKFQQIFIGFLRWVCLKMWWISPNPLLMIISINPFSDTNCPSLLWFDPPFPDKPTMDSGRLAAPGCLYFCSHLCWGGITSEAKDKRQMFWDIKVDFMIFNCDLMNLMGVPCSYDFFTWSKWCGFWMLFGYLVL